jgi:hypothetical protein
MPVVVQVRVAAKNSAREPGRSRKMGEEGCLRVVATSRLWVSSREQASRRNARCLEQRGV